MVCLEGQPDRVLPQEARVWAAHTKRSSLGSPEWLQVSSLTTGHMMALPMDMTGMASTVDACPMSVNGPDSSVNAYIACCLLAEGYTGSEGSRLKLPRILALPGMGALMLRTAVMMRSVKLSGTDIILSPYLLSVLLTLSAGGEEVAYWGIEARTAACRAWMETAAPWTPSRQGVLLVTRLLRSVMRECHAVTTWTMEATARYSTETLGTHLRMAVRIENGMGWSKVRSVSSMPACEHTAMLVADDDSRVHDGIYLRDSTLMPLVVST